eukprot:1138465-Pelagomonas_calceolata.AAC.4
MVSSMSQRAAGEPKKGKDSESFLGSIHACACRHGLLLCPCRLVRYFGVSNETSYGVSEFCHLAKANGLPKPVSIQNSYSLLMCCVNPLLSGMSFV